MTAQKKIKHSVKKQSNLHQTFVSENKLNSRKQVKTGIASKRLKPNLALIDPSATYSLPRSVVAASGFDVLAHALESYTARPYTMRSKPGSPAARPMSQGANPWSDIGCEAALKLLGKYLVRAVNDALPINRS